jgi:hypothetical protein
MSVGRNANISGLDLRVYPIMSTSMSTPAARLGEGPSEVRGASGALGMHLHASRMNAREIQRKNYG